MPTPKETIRALECINTAGMACLGPDCPYACHNDFDCDIDGIEADAIRLLKEAFQDAF